MSDARPGLRDRVERLFAAGAGADREERSTRREEREYRQYLTDE